MRDLYVNYDCDVACTNLFETLGRCMCHSAVPDSGSALTSLHTLALEGMLAILRGLAAAGGAGAASRPADGADAAPSVVVAAAPGENGGDLSPLTVTAALGGLGAAPELHRLSQMRAAEVLRLRKQLKRRLALASQRFNTDAKHWIEYAQVRASLPCPHLPRSASPRDPLSAPSRAGVGAAADACRRALRCALPARLSRPRPDAHRPLHLRARRCQARLPDVRAPPPAEEEGEKDGLRSARP